MTPKKDEYMRGYGEAFKEAAAEKAELVAALREARQFMMAPAEDLLWGIVHRIDAAISRAS
jgi:hypothetical protein